MALEDLVSQQQAAVTPSAEENAVVKSDEAVATELNAAGEVGEAVDTQQESAGDVHDEVEADGPEWYQKRLGRMAGKNRELEEIISRQNEKLEALEARFEDNQPKTLQDLDSTALRRFIADNKHEDDMFDHVEEAQVLLQEKIVEERLAAEREKFQQEQDTQRIKQLENQLVGIIAGDDAGNPSSELYTNAEAKYSVLQSEFGQSVVNNPLAPALSFALAKLEASTAPSLTKRVLNRNERIESTSRNPVAADGSVESYLRENSGRLDKSTLNNRGTLNKAVRKLKMFQE